MLRGQGQGRWRALGPGSWAVECSWIAGSSGGVRGDRGTSTVADRASVWKFCYVLGEITHA
jgi:hypothetical protein